ncbi:hypothetical protein ACFPPD_17965 [Cohnella suwonensis]|uniref:Integral membrane protein n=1 Tax=Cohnella suwonensis TaxID=696072 RepID=A0ABW0LZX3_9BACL
MSKPFGIVKTYLTDKWSWVALPWVILFSSFSINLLLAGSIGDEMTTGGLASIFIYTFVLGIISLSQTFPFIIGFGARRKDYFAGTAATISIVGACSSVALAVLAWIERQSDGWGVHLHFFSLPYFSDGSTPMTALFFFGAMTNLFFAGFVISSIHRKFGRNGLFLFFALIGLALTATFYLLSYYEGWQMLGDWLDGGTLLQLTGTLLAITFVYGAASYALLRRATV